MTTTTVEELNDAARAARRARAEWIVGLESGLVTVADVLDAAKRENGAAVARLKLSTLLTAAYGAPRAKACVRHVRAVLDVDTPSADLTVGWLTDHRTGGRRIMALADALNPRNAPPVPGFPFRTTNHTRTAA